MQKQKNILNRKRTLTRLMAAQIFDQFEFFEKKIALEKIKQDTIQNYILQEDDEPKSFLEKIDVAFLDNLINGLDQHHEAIDAQIEKLITRGNLGKNPRLLMQIIRLACFELQHFVDVPAKVVISEYVDIAAMFFGLEQVSFVNSILETASSIRH